MATKKKIVHKKVKKKNSRKRINKRKNSRLLFLLLWLFVLGITLTTSSYAWFSSNRLATVMLMDVKVAAQNGIEISADAIDWGPELEVDDWEEVNQTYTTNINHMPTTLEPISTIGEVENGLLNMYFGDVENDGNTTNFLLRTTKLVEERGFGDVFEGKFLAFDIFLKATQDTKLYLTGGSGATYVGESSVGIENSMRFAFVIEGTVPEDTSIGTVQNLKTNNSNNVYIWEPNYDVHTDSAIENARETYGLNIGSTSGILPYDGVRAEITRADRVYTHTAKAENFPNFFKKVDIAYATKSNFNHNIEVFSLQTGITKVRVYIWIEGQDVDCEDNAAIGEISFNLQFSTNPS